MFFACGACHILAHAFLERHQPRAIWLKPDPGFTGNHIFIAGNGWVFDFHGYSDPTRFLAHAWTKARRWWPGWHARRITLPPEVLVSEALSLRYEGLRLREPGQFLHDPVPRALRFLDRFPAPPG